MRIEFSGAAAQENAQSSAAETAALGLAQVQAALDRLEPGVKIIEFDRSTATSQQAADNVGCHLGQIVKSLGFMINKSLPILVLTSGDQMIDERKLAALFGVGRKKARMMNAQQCLAILGYAPGGVPPIGHRGGGIAVYLDESLKRYETVYAAGGAANAIFPMRLSRLQEVTDGVFADLIKA